MRSVILAILSGAALCALLAYILLGAPVSGWRLGLHGWIALSLGSVLSVALAVGLMALMFHSSRRGYDDRVRDLHDDAGTPD
jgi:hypothetical protein